MKSGLSIKLTDGKEELPVHISLLLTKVPPPLPAFATTVPATLSLRSEVILQFLFPSATKLESAEYNPSIAAVVEDAVSPIALLTVISPFAENIAVEPIGTRIFSLIFKFPLISITKFLLAGNV